MSYNVAIIGDENTQGEKVNTAKAVGAELKNPRSFL